MTVVSARNTQVFRMALTALTENFTLPIAQAMGQVAYIPHLLISKMYFGHWECLRVVGPESQGGQIPEYTGLM